MSDAKDRLRKSIAEDIDRVIRENLSDPDIAAKSPDYRDGYAQGFREAVAGYVALRLRSNRP